MRKNSKLISPIIRRKPRTVDNRGCRSSTEFLLRRMGKQEGLTLVELIIVIAILSLFMSSLFTVFQNSLDAWGKSAARLAVYQNARIALDQMTRDIQPAIFDAANEIYAKGYEKGSGIKNGSAADEFFFVSVLDAGEADLAEIGYWIDSRHNLWRHYHTIDEPKDFPPNFTTEAENELASNITDLQFKFHYRTQSLGWAVTADGNWDAAADKVANYSSCGAAQNPDGLPNAVEIEITVVDPAEREQQKFSTMVYIPQAK